MVKVSDLKDGILDKSWSDVFLYCPLCEEKFSANSGVISCYKKITFLDVNVVKK